MMLILKQAKIKRLEKKTDGGENRREISVLVLSRRAFIREFTLALAAYFALNSPATALAQAAGFDEGDLNKVVIYVMDIFRVKVDGKESEKIPSHGEYVIKALEDGNVLGSKKREGPEIIKVNVGVELISSKGTGKPVSQYEYYSGTQYYGVLGQIYEYVRDNPFKKIIVVIGLPHSDKSSQEIEFINELVRRGSIVVVGAGNENVAIIGNVIGASPEIVSVAAIEGKGFIGYGEDKKVKKAGYSNYGRSVDITADGAIELTKKVNDVSTVYKRQTSGIAAARVARLIAQMQIENHYLTRQDVFKILKERADPIEGIDAADDYYRQGLLGAGVVNYKKSLDNHEPVFTSQPVESGEKEKYISGPGMPFVRVLAWTEIVVSGLVLILLWSSYKEIEAYFKKMSLMAKIFYIAVIVIAVNWIRNNGVALLYDICGKGLADYIMRQIGLGLYAEGIFEITKIFIYLFVLVLLIQVGRSVIRSMKSRNASKSCKEYRRDKAS